MEPTIRVSFGGGLKVQAEYQGFVIPTDQPVEAGGNGSAPEPFTLFLASIGTCAGIYVLSYLKNHGLPTEGVFLEQGLGFDPVRHRLSRVSLKIHVPAGFPERHRKALERSADLCAVKRAMHEPPEFVITSVEDA